MHDAVTVSLLIMAVALLRRPLLTAPDAAPDVRRGESTADTAAATSVRATANRPQIARRTST